MARNWTRDELLLAMNLYCRTPFGRMHKTNPDVVALATALGRTPSSVAMKLCNLASLDPAERARGIAGLKGASAADRAIWNEFHADWAAAAYESETLYRERVPSSVVEPQRTTEPALPSDDEILRRSAAETESTRSVKVRTAQAFFRRAVLASYKSTCCITGITLPELLIASHILPWSDHPDRRVNPCNGLCLSRLHDAAFDRGLITFDSDLRLILSKRISDHVTNPVLAASFQAFANQPLTLPEKFQPDRESLERHRMEVFSS